MSKFVPNSYQTPNIYIDRILPLLTSLEWVILSFAIRHRTITLSHLEDAELVSEAHLKAFEDLKKYRLLAPAGVRVEGALWVPVHEEERIDFDGLRERKDGGVT